jgi:hypothetical protein
MAARRKHGGCLPTLVVLLALGALAIGASGGTLGLVAAVFGAGVLTGAALVYAFVRPRVSLRVSTRGTRARPSWAETEPRGRRTL